MSRMISPNELHQAAIDMQLGGQPPATEHEWAIAVNFWARNIEPAACVPATVLMAKIMDCPLPESYVREIAEFQADPEHRKPNSASKA